MCIWNCEGNLHAYASEGITDPKQTVYYVINMICFGDYFYDALCPVFVFTYKFGIIQMSTLKPTNKEFKGMMKIVRIQHIDVSELPKKYVKSF